MKLIASAVIAVLLLLTGFLSAHVVPPGAVGVVRTFGSVQAEPIPPGLHFLNPFAIVTDFDVHLQSTTAKNAEGGTVDLQQVFEDVTLNYEFDAKAAPMIYAQFGDTATISASFIEPALYETFKAVTAKYTAEQLVTKRALVSADIIQQLGAKLAKYHVIVSDINVQNFKFDDAFARAIQQKVVAGQQRETAEQNLETSQVLAQQKIVEANAQAKVIAIQAQAIQQQGGAEYVNLEAVKRWDGHLPSQWSGAAIPFVNFSGK